MINTSKAYKKQIKGNRIMSLHDEYIFAAGGVLPLCANDFVKYNIDESTSEQSKFSIGAAVIKKYSAVLNNESEKFSPYDFEGLDILARVGLKLPGGTTEILQKGRYRCVKAKANENTINIEAYDSMLFFDRQYSESSLVYPAKIREIVADACHVCGVICNETTIEQGDFIVEKRPEEMSITFRDVISYCAQIMGCYAKIDAKDQLVFGWYDFDTLEILQSGYDGGNFKDYTSGDSVDGGNFKDYTSGDALDGGTFRDLWKYHHLYSLGSQSINTDDVTITGICITTEKGDAEETENYIYGNEGYVLKIEKNPFILSETSQAGKPSAQVVAEHIGKKIVGKAIRPLSISCQSDPAIEAGDCICVTDRKQRTYFTVITNTTYVFGGAQKIECSAETPTEKQYEKYGAATKLLEKAENETKKQISRYDIAVRHLTDLMVQSFGVFKTEEKLEDGSVIYYLHDKPKLEESKTIWKMTADAFAVSTDGGKAWNAGMDSSGNTVVNVLSAIGINADWINTGTLSVKKNGKTVLYVDVDTGRVDIVADSFSLSSGKTIEEIAQEKAFAQLNDFVSAVYDNDIANLQAQIDGQIETWYYDHEPELNNMPASEWKTESDRVKHEGDLFYWKSKGYSYRFLKDGEGWKWQIITDSDITKALAKAAQAQDTADSKRRVFITTPQPPYDVGDLWTQGIDGDIMRCQVGRQSGTYVSTDWDKASKYTDDTAVKELDEKLDSTEEIFNRLTQKGAVQGIYLENGQLFVNAEYIKTGILRSIKIINGNDGEFSVDENGHLVATSARIEGDLSGSRISNGNGAFFVDENGKMKATDAEIRGKIVGVDGYYLRYVNKSMKPNIEKDFKFVEVGYEEPEGAGTNLPTDNVYISFMNPFGMEMMSSGGRYSKEKNGFPVNLNSNVPIFNNGAWIENAVINTLAQNYIEVNTVRPVGGDAFEQYPHVEYRARVSGAFSVVHGVYRTKSHGAGKEIEFSLSRLIEKKFAPTYSTVRTIGFQGKRCFYFALNTDAVMSVRNLSESDLTKEDVAEIRFRFDYFVM